MLLSTFSALFCGHFPFFDPFVFSTRSPAPRFSSCYSSFFSLFVFKSHRLCLFVVVFFYKYVRIFDGNVSFALKYCEANFDKYQRNKKTTKWIFRCFLERAGGGGGNLLSFDEE